MKLTSQLAAFKQRNSDLSADVRATLSCDLAKQLEKAGEYDAACEALSEFWPQQNESLNIKSLEQPTKAEVLLRAGALAGWLGSANQTNGSQETAKNLITRSIEIFEELGQTRRIAEGRNDLALCYWREGAFQEARIHLKAALAQLKNEDSDLRACVLVRLGMVELRAGQLSDALRIHNEAADVVLKSNDPALKGAFHNQLATLYEHLRTRQSHNEYTDRALIEYAAASFHFEEAGNNRYLARVENNLGYLFLTLERYKDAHSHLDRARNLFLQLEDIGTVAQVDETRARVFLGEGRLKEAERVIRSSVKSLEKGGEQALLAEALTTQGVIQARLRNHARSQVLLQRAAEIAQTAGDLEGAGRAQLSIIEELSGQTTARELAVFYQSAAELLHRSQDPSSSQRLIACARKVINLITAEQNRGLAIEQQSWDGFSLRREVKRIERTVIERALRDAGGSVSKAARLLGFKHHQSLISLIEGRHSELQEQRSIVRRRRRHLFSKVPRGTRRIIEGARPGRASLVLHVEDNRSVARVVRDRLSADRMNVESCVNGSTALEILKGADRYDALVVDDNLPGLSGLELILRVRSMSHRSNLPIVMLSGADCEKEAWRAGVDAFLLKPGAINELSLTISRVVEERRKNSK